MARTPKPSKVRETSGPEDAVELDIQTAGSFNNREVAFRNGNLLALWDEVFVCAKGKKVLPEWARLPLMEYLRSQRFLDSIPSKKGKGAKARAYVTDNDLWFCARVFESVNLLMRKKHKAKGDEKRRTFCQECKFIFQRKARPYSFTQACKHALKETGLPDWQAVRRAYCRVGDPETQRLKKGFFASRLSLRIVPT